jgi:L-threonylcarbamoyladenylate synthase
MASAFQIRCAASIIRRGGIIVYSTDTVYGLGCDPRNHAAVNAINHLKQRPASKSMILLASNIQQLASYIDSAEIPADFAWQTTEPTSWIMPASDTCPHWLCHDDGSVAIRITRHKLVSALCEQLQSAIISTSANVSGGAPLSDRLGIQRSFGDSVDAILFSDEAATGRPSVIKNYSDQTIIRQ